MQQHSKSIKHGMQQHPYIMAMIDKPPEIINSLAGTKTSAPVKNQPL